MMNDNFKFTKFSFENNKKINIDLKYKKKQTNNKIKNTKPNNRKTFKKKIIFQKRSPKEVYIFSKDSYNKEKELIFMIFDELYKNYSKKND